MRGVAKLGALKTGDAIGEFIEIAVIAARHATFACVSALPTS